MPIQPQIVRAPIDLPLVFKGSDTEPMVLILPVAMSEAQAEVLVSEYTRLTA